jgi:hypothetical protein
VSTELAGTQEQKKNLQRQVSDSEERKNFMVNLKFSVVRKNPPNILKHILEYISDHDSFKEYE